MEISYPDFPDFTKSEKREILSKLDRMERDLVVLSNEFMRCNYATLSFKIDKASRRIAKVHKKFKDWKWINLSKDSKKDR